MIFDLKDQKIMEWAFCKHMCEDGSQSFTDYQLFLNSGIKGVMGDQDLMREYVLDDADNIYRKFVRRVMGSLIAKGFVHVVRKIPETDTEITEYEMTQKLIDNCQYFKKYMMGNVDDIDTGSVNPL